jgi:aquaporin Z
VFAVLPDDVLAKDHVAITAGFVIGERAVLVIQSMLNGDLASHLIGRVRQITTNPIRFLVNTTYSIGHIRPSTYGPPTAICSIWSAEPSDRKLRSHADVGRKTPPFTKVSGPSCLETVVRHWPEYLMECGELASYMFVVCATLTLLRHPAPLRHLTTSGISRRTLTGLVMGITAIAIVRSPCGRQSGAHFNPAVTFTFYRLGKVHLWDAIFYIAAQLLGGSSGVALAHYLLQDMPGDRAICHAITVPGLYGAVGAFLGELSISFIFMTAVLFISNNEKLARYTPYSAGSLVAAYITFESPLSGMSMNSARTFGSAVYATDWSSLWIYFIAPLSGMLTAAEFFLWLRNGALPRCAKLYHTGDKRCIFKCGYRSTPERPT